MQLHRYAMSIIALLVLLAVATAPAPAQPIDFAEVDPADHTFDDWYLDEIDGQPSGYWHTWMQIEKDRIVTGYEDVGVESHGGEQMHNRTRVLWTETLDFKPLTIRVETQSGSETVTQTYRFNDQGIELTSEQNGRSMTRQLPPIKGDYLTAAQQAIANELHHERGDKDYQFNTLDPLAGMTPYITHHQQADEQTQPFKLADGTHIDATRWVTTYSILPGFEMQSWIDKQPRVLGLSYEVGGMTLTARLADETVTEMDFDPPEMAQHSVVVPDRPIKNPGQQRKIVYELTYQGGESEIVPITTTLQSVERLGKGRARVTVDLDAPWAEQIEDQDVPTKANLAASIKIDHTDSAVLALAKRAVKKIGEDPSPEEIALACKRFVTRHIRGATLAIGDATASEAARTGKGDCTECAVLLAALLRAHEIPSRCVSGLVYSEEAFAGQKNAFVFHLWTQAWIKDDQGNGRWVDLDAAMWRYTAGHIALGASNMGDNDQADLIKLIPMMQGLEIKVIETSQ